MPKQRCSAAKDPAPLAAPLSLHAVTNSIHYMSASCTMADSAPAEAQRWFAGRCYCGGITFKVSDSCDPSETTSPPPAVTVTRSLPPASVRALFCHCDSCRRAHSAPLYQVVYLPESCFEITAGAHLLQAFARSPQHVVRSFCSMCGSRVSNRVTMKPALGVGFFPNLLDEDVQRSLPEVCACVCGGGIA